MIKLSEVRLGNLVFDNELKNISVVSYLDFKFANQNNGTSRLISPIPITEDILLKLGFEKDKEISYRYHLEDFISYDIDDNCVSIYDTWLVKRFPYLHQFMNLYFAILGEELPTDKILKA